MAKIIHLHFSSYRISLEIIFRIWSLRTRFGFSINDLAFLADINPDLLASIEDPTQRIDLAIIDEHGNSRLRPISVGEYDLDQFDFFRGIFANVPLKELIPKHFMPEDMIDVVAVCEVSPGKRHLKIFKIQKDVENTLLYDFDKELLELIPLKFYNKIDKLKEIIKELMASGYFNEPQLAVHLYHHIIENYKLIPKPIVLEKALSSFTGSKKGTRLSRQKLKDEHTMYVMKD